MLISNEFEFSLNSFGSRNQFRFSADHQSRPADGTGRLLLYSAFINLTDLLQGEKEDILPSNGTEYPLKSADFFNTHPVFSLDQAVEVLAPPGGQGP